MFVDSNSYAKKYHNSYQERAGGVRWLAVQYNAMFPPPMALAQQWRTACYAKDEASENRIFISDSCERQSAYKLPYSGWDFIVQLIHRKFSQTMIGC